MFNRKTIFILGAGASWHYGYPTGEELVRKVIAASEKLGEVFEDSGKRIVQPYPKFVCQDHIDQSSSEAMREPWFAAQHKCKELGDRLRVVNPLVIDYFLGQNPTVADIGKLLICWVILECEEQYLLQHGNPNRREILERSPIERDRLDIKNLDITKYKDGWYRFVLHKLVTGCETNGDLHRNDVSFVTFNYDVSLEYTLHHGLNAIDTFYLNDITEFLGNQRVIHCYGKVRESVNPPKRPLSLSSFFNKAPKQPGLDPNIERQHDSNRRELLDEVFEASKRLSMINPKEKISNADLMQAEQKRIRQADVVYILGYGFDENNTDRIGLATGLARPNPKNVMFTNFGDINRVNKKAGRALHGNFSVFLPGNNALRTFSPSGYVEKSTKNVYDALEQDFDELEDG